MNKMYLMRLITLLCVFLFGSPTTASAVWQQPPEQFTNDLRVNALGGATDGKGNALAIWTDGNLDQVQSSYFSALTQTWGATQIVSPLGSDPFSLVLAMDATGTAVALWLNGDTSNILTGFFNGSNWSSPNPDPLATLNGGSDGEQAIAMNGNGQAVGLWINLNLSTVNASFFSGGAGGSWSTPTSIGTGDNSDTPSVAYSKNGTAVALWNNAGMITANHWNGTAWGVLPTMLGAASFGLQVQMDASGHAIAGWLDPSSNVLVSVYNGTAWSIPQIISASPNNSSISIAMAPGGTAVLTWADAASNGVFSAYDGTSFGVPIPYASNLAFALKNPSVSVDSVGNALIAYETNTPEILSVQLPLGGAPATPLIIDPNPQEGLILEIFSALSDGGRGFAFWLPNGEGADAFASALISFPDPAIGLQGTICTNKFPSQTDRIHIITWTPSADPSVVSYELRRNGILIAVIPAAGPFIYYDHNRCKNVADEYILTSVNSSGSASLPLTIILK